MKKIIEFIANELCSVLLGEGLGNLHEAYDNKQRRAQLKVALSTIVESEQGNDYYDELLSVLENSRLIHDCLSGYDSAIPEHNPNERINDTLRKFHVPIEKAQCVAGVLKKMIDCARGIMLKPASSEERRNAYRIDEATGALLMGQENIISEIAHLRRDLIEKQSIKTDYNYGIMEPQTEVFTANDLYAKSFQEPLFLHKRKDSACVNLVNLFIIQKYKEVFPRISNNPVQENLPGRLATFVRGKEQFLFIEGNAGSGKSSLVGWINYYASINDDRATDILGDYPLLTVRLRDLNRQTISKEHGLTNAILEYIHVSSLDELERVFPKAVMILDGFDELCMIDNIIHYEDLLWDLYRRVSQNYRVIVTVRPQYIKETINFPHCTISLQHFDEKQREEWLFYYTSPEICGQSIDPSVYKYILNIEESTDSAICDTPMTLYMLAAKETSIETISNSWRLYHHLFYSELSDTEYNQMFHSPNRDYSHRIAPLCDVLYRINEEIAYRMYRSKNNKFFLSYNELSEIIEELSKEEECLRNESIKVIIQQCYALCTYWKERDDEGAVEFYHNNIRDFFLCEKIFRVTNEIYKRRREKRITSDEMISMIAQQYRDMFWYDSLETMVCQFIRLRTMHNEDENIMEFPEMEVAEKVLPELFEHMLTDGTIYYTSERSNFIQSAINILSCTVQIYRHAYDPLLNPGEKVRWWSNPENINRSEILQYVFRYIFKKVPVMISDDIALTLASKGDFSKIDFQKSDLRNIGFQDALLVGANLSDTILCGCDFSGANLNNADLTNADVHYACLKGAMLEKCRLTGADLRGTDLPDGSCCDNQEEQIRQLRKLKIEGLIV